MPTYSAKCQNDHTFDYFCMVANRNDDDQRKCPECGALGERTWETSGFGGGHGFPYTTNNILPGGKPLVIESLAHLRRVEKEHGVVVRGFSDFSASSAQDPLKDLPHYRENGRAYEGQLAPNLRPKTKHWWDD